jgi:hypothetical protein
MTVRHRPGSASLPSRHTGQIRLVAGSGRPGRVIVALILAAVLNLSVFAVETIEFLDALQHLALGADGGRGHVAFGQMWCLIGLGVATVVTHVARRSWGATEPAETPAPATGRSAMS